MGTPTAASDDATQLADTVRQLRAAGCVFAEEEAGLLAAAATGPAELAALVRRRVDGLPLEQVLGYAEFGGVRVSLRPGVFVPRRRTTVLVDLAARHTPPGGTVVDLCCGSGALGAALATRVPGITLYAADVSAVAVACARDNLAALGARVYLGDLFAALPDTLRGRIDVLLANVPYVPTGHLGLLPAEARLHEPRSALDGGPDGLDLLRRVADEAPGWLATGGRMYVETTAAQSGPAQAALAAAGLTPRVVTDEELDATVVIGALDTDRH